MHYLNYNRRLIQVERQREKQVIQRNGIRVPLETVTLTTLGKTVFSHSSTQCSVFTYLFTCFRNEPDVLAKFPGSSNQGGTRKG